jgi:hypothetical protein
VNSVGQSNSDIHSDTPFSWFAKLLGRNSKSNLEFQYFSGERRQTVDGIFSSYDDFERLVGSQADSFAIYHLELGEELERIIELALHHPGVLWVHDLAVVDTATIQRLLSASLCAVFSSQRVLSQWSVLTSRNLDESTPLFLLPLPAPIESFENRSLEVRSRDESHIAFCGFPSLESRAHCLLEALERSERSFRLHWLIAESEMQLANNLLRDFPSVQVELESSRNGERWSEILLECDVAAHLSFSASRGLGIYLPISLSSYCPVLVSDCADSALLPDSIVYKTGIGVGESENIKLALEDALTEDGKIRAKAARNYAVECHSPELICSELRTLSAYRLRP